MRAGLLLALLLSSTSALARPIRARFEPTDLELERPGVLDLDFQLGYLWGAQPRLVLPDFEFDLGISRRFELDVDGTYAIDPRTPEAPSVPDNLWLSGKIGVFEARLARWALLAGGLQLGPRLPVAHGAQGVGVDALVLIGLVLPRTHLVLNVGGYVDPSQPLDDPSSRARPIGVQVGLDCDVDLTTDGKWGFHASLGGVAAIAVDPSQLVLAAGVVFSPTSSLDLSLLALAGFLPGADRVGGLVGVSPKIVLWRH